MEGSNRRGIAVISVLLILMVGCSDSAREAGSVQTTRSSTSTANPTAPSTTSSTVASTSSSVAALHQWGQIDDLVACPDYIEATITNDRSGELRLVSLVIYFPDQPEWQDRAAWWDDPERLLPGVPPGDSAIWRVTPADVGRQSPFSPGDYRVLIGTEFDPDPDLVGLSSATVSSIEGGFVDDTLPSPRCG
jgi:hypothetical protein